MAGAYGADRKLRRAARLLAHVCGLALAMKRYIGKSRAEEWAQFFLSVKTCSMSELLCSRSNFSKYNLIQLCLEKNRSFRSLPNEIQLQLCQTAIYQEYEAQSVVLRQGHVPLECCLILAGRLKVLWSNTNMNKNSNPEILSEFEEGDFIGEICLLTNANRPTSVLCKTDVKLLVINKEDFCCILAQRIQDQYQETCSFLRNLPLFSSWPKDKTDFLAHCSLRRYYRANTIIIPDNLNSHFLVFIISALPLADLQLIKEGAQGVDAYTLAKTCFSVKEYDQEAHFLRDCNSKKANFLYMYSRYLSGEKRMMSLGPLEKRQVKNEALRELRVELSEKIPSLRIWWIWPLSVWCGLDERGH
ncbi:uncharacterized protein LOC131480729 [Ochotona princeps]|uniref:uncharacterized protein LOC131480729 n=1 Tax=Ochotona princeps TaxID=9978 RepID=UPI002714BDC5|nr:uncharacterized protein LOC131480729 [Ochotona princeps]